ncbi:MAG: McrB family protein [Prevotella sp.]
MRIKNTAFVNNVTVQGSSNCDWGTDIGQSKKHTFTLEGFPEFINAMAYYKIEDVEEIKVILGKGNRTPRPISTYAGNQLVLASCFEKVFLNGKYLEGQRLIVYIIKETNEYNSKGKINVHKNRCTLKFSNSLLYRDESVNQKCINAITKAFGLSTNGSWAILEMNIVNEDELHLRGFAIGDYPKNYSSTDERNEDFAARFNEIIPIKSKYPIDITDKKVLQSSEYSYISAIKTKPFLILGGFSGTGKSQKVKELAFATCPCDVVLNVSETSPGNYLLVSVKPNWHDATDITGFRSSVNRNYYVTDFMRFLIKAMHFPNVPFFVCLDEMNLAPVEEYFADFLSVIESRKRRADGKIVTDAIVPASVFNDTEYAADFNIFMTLGLELTDPKWKADDIHELSGIEQSEAFVRQDIVEELKQNGLTIPSNVIIIGTVNMDDTTNSFSRKVIDRAMTFETVVGKFGDEYFNSDVALNYVNNPLKGELFLSDEVRATQMIDEGRFILTKEEQTKILNFINDINEDLDGSPFKISYRILNETILLYRSKKRIAEIIKEEGGLADGVEFKTDLNTIFDDILMQKVLPRIEGDYEKCSKCLNKLSLRADNNEWLRSYKKIEFMIKRFGSDRSGITSFWN